MQFGQAFSFAFKDPDWIKKIGLIALISLIPIVGQIVALGFALEIMKRVINNDPNPLPALDFGGFLGKGFQAFIIGLVYVIPMIIFMIPIYLVPIIGTSVDNSNVMSIVTVAVSCICGGLSVIYGILLAFMLPAAYGKFITEGSLGAGFRFGEVLGIVRKALVAYLIALVGTALAGIIVPFGAILCGIGIYITMAYYFTVMGHFYGQAYRQAISS